MTEFGDQCHKCDNCPSFFPSRNKLFKHINSRICFNTIGVNVVKSPIDEDYDFMNKFDVFIYVLGGRERGKTLSSVERYNIKYRRWEACPRMLENRGSHGAAAIKSQIFAIGGGGLRSNLSTCESFDYHSNTWEFIPTMLSCRHALSVVVLFDKIFVVGGWENGTICSNTTECYDILTKTWIICAPMPTPRRLLGLAAINNEIFAFGGHRDDPHWYTDCAEAYNPILNSWRSLRKLPVASGASAIAVNSFIFVFLHGKYTVKYCPISDDYLKLSPLPMQEWYCFDVVALGNIIYIYGGAVNGKWSRDGYAYHTINDTWEALPPMQQARRRCATALLIIPSTEIFDIPTAAVEAVMNSDPHEIA